MTKTDAYKYIQEVQKYLKYQDNTKFPIKAKKYLPIETLKSLAALEASLQVGYQLCPIKRTIQAMEKLKVNDRTSRGRLIDSTIDSCIFVFKDIMKNGTTNNK